MVLCGVCQKIDVREMLQLALLEHDTKDTNQGTKCRLCSLLDDGIAHHDSYAALRAAADHGCEFCSLIRQALLEEYGRSDSVSGEAPQTETKQQSHPVVLSPYKVPNPTASRDRLPKIQVRVGLRGPAEFILDLEAFAARESFPSDGYGLLHTAIHENSAEASCLKQAAEWLQTCWTDHPRCRRVKIRNTRPPSRLLDVGPRDEPNDPYLCLATRDVRSWVALSYCWGGQCDFVLNDATIESLRRGISLSSFPATIRDAVIITRRLGIRYLWVDALCIKQNSLDDWLQECARMGDVYKGAMLTLVAGNAPSVHTGIFSIRTSKLDRCPLPWSVSNDGGQPSSGQGRRVYMRASTWNRETQRWPIRQRGWTLQEDLLSPRTLTYSNCRMVWECSTHIIDEGSRITPRDQLPGKAVVQNMLQKSESRLPSWMSRKALQNFVMGKLELTRAPLATSPYRRWSALVFEYTSRALSKETDVLPALSGLVSAFARENQDVYCAGLWRKDLLHGLLWTLDPASASKAEAQISRPSEYRSPSWSWASINGWAIRMEPQAFPRVYMERTHERAKIIRVNLELVASSDPFGLLKSGQLTVVGRFYHIGNSLESDGNEASKPFPAALKALRASMLVKPWMGHEFYQQHKPCARQHFALLLLVDWPHDTPRRGAEYLILESAATDASVYRRIGLLSLWRDPAEAPVGSDNWLKDSLMLGGDELINLVKDAFQELQGATAIKKMVKII